MRTIFDCRCNEGAGGLFPALDVPSRGADQLLGPELLRTTSLRMPNLSETQVARHYTALSKLNYGVDDGMYPSWDHYRIFLIADRL